MADAPKGSGILNALQAKIRRIPKALGWLVLVLGFLALLLGIASFFVDEPLREYMETRMNSSLKGYSASLPSVRFHLVGFSVTLTDLKIYQQAHPETPVLHIPSLHASVHWVELLRARLVAEFDLTRPNVYVNLAELKEEYTSKVPLKKRGWQETVQAIYPLKINHLIIDEGGITYIDKDPKKPLQVSHICLYSTNIRNILSPESTYPSPFHLECTIFNEGRWTVNGNADFLAKPFPGIKADYVLERVAFEPFKPIAARLNLNITGSGTLSSSGDVEYSPKVKRIHVKDVTVAGLHLDYVHSPVTAPAESRRAHKAKEAAKKASDNPEILFRADRLELKESTIGWVNKAKDPGYRIFMSGMELTVRNLSNHFAEGPAEVDLRGRFMGSGSTRATATFRSEKNGADFDIMVAIENTQLTTLNDLLRAYGKFDVAAGLFSFYSELHIKKDTIDGYVKPLFRDMVVYDKRQDADKSLFRKMYEGLIGGLAELLKNREEGDVATKAEVSGRLDNPKANTLQIVERLIQNAFFRAILPGFDNELSRLHRP